jgi:Bacterial Ig-like domain (group 3)
LEGNFVKRFATGEPMQAPWGVTQASANFGPFSNAILIGNTVDGSINAFDPANGNSLGAIRDGDGNVIRDLGLHAMTFRPDGFGDPDALYITAGIGGGLDGVFGEIKSGLVSTTNVSAQAPASGTTFTFMATVAPGPGNTGTPMGTVTLTDSGLKLGSAPLGNGAASFTATLIDVGQHQIMVQYSGDSNFLPSSFQTNVQVGLATTMLTLIAPANADAGVPVDLTATISSPGGTPTGRIIINDGNTVLGMAALSATGVATLTVSTLSPGNHSLTATYSGDGTFGPSTSGAVAINIVRRDFMLGAAPPAATVVAGQSATFLLTVTPAGGFVDNVTFSCASAAGLMCSFQPATVTPTNGAASTTLIVSTSASVPHYGFVRVNVAGNGAGLAALALCCLVIWHGAKLRIARPPLMGATAVLLAVMALSLALSGCGGYSAGATQTTRGTVALMVTAQSGSVSHATTVMVTVQ